MKCVCAGALYFRALRDPRDGECDGGLRDKRIELRTTDVVGESGKLALGDGLEVERDRAVGPEDECRTRFVLANFRDPLAHTETIQHRENGGDERFADEEVRPRTVVKKCNGIASLDEMAGKRGTGWPATEDGDCVDAFFHRQKATRYAAKGDALSPTGAQGAIRDTAEGRRINFLPRASSSQRDRCPPIARVYSMGSK